MSVPYDIRMQKEEISEKLMISADGKPSDQPRASDKIPIIARPFVSDRAKKFLNTVRRSLHLTLEAV